MIERYPLGQQILIEAFVDTLSATAEIDVAWREFIGTPLSSVTFRCPRRAVRVAA